MKSFWGAKSAQQQEEERKAQMSLDIYQRAYAESDAAMKLEARGDFPGALSSYRRCLQWIQSDPSRLMADEQVTNETTLKLMTAIRTIEDHAKDRIHALKVIVDDETTRVANDVRRSNGTQVPAAVQAAPMNPVFTDPTKLKQRTSFERDSRASSGTKGGRRGPSPVKKMSESLRPQPKTRPSTEGASRSHLTAEPAYTGHGPNSAQQAASNAAMLAWPRGSAGPAPPAASSGVYRQHTSGSNTSLNSRPAGSRPESRNSGNRVSRELPRYTLTDEPVRSVSRNSDPYQQGPPINRATPANGSRNVTPTPPAQSSVMPRAAQNPVVPKQRTTSAQSINGHAAVVNASAAATKSAARQQPPVPVVQKPPVPRTSQPQAPVQQTRRAAAPATQPTIQKPPAASVATPRQTAPARTTASTAVATTPRQLPTTNTSPVVKPPLAAPTRLVPAPAIAVEAEGEASPLPEDKYERAEAALKNVKGLDETLAKTIINEIVDQGDEVHWEDIAGLEAAKSSLKETVVYPLLRPDLFSGLREPVTGMLLFGPPGTGKTMLARAVATQAKATFFSISASSLTSKYLGESEKLVRALFVLAKELSPSIIFVDEIDSLLSSRGEGEHESSRRLKTEFLIQWSNLAKAAAGSKNAMDARVLVLAATNLPWAIDDAARRRFVRRQYIPLPEDTTRAQHLRHLIRHQKHTLSEDELDELTTLTDGFSGSDLTALAKDAAMGPLRSLGDALLTTDFDKIRPMGMEDFRASLRTIRPSVGKTGLEEYVKWNEEFGSM